MCSICFNENKKYRNLTCSCGHTFHKKCINKWLKTENTCPLCRKIINNNHQTTQQHTTNMHGDAYIYMPITISVSSDMPFDLDMFMQSIITT